MGCDNINDDKTQQALNKLLNNSELKIIEAAQEALGLEFGRPLDDTPEIKTRLNNRENELKEKKAILYDAEKVTLPKTKDSKQRMKIKKSIDKLKDDIKKLKRKVDMDTSLLNSAPLNFETKKKIVKLVQERLVKVSEKTSFTHQNFGSYANVLQWHLRDVILGYGTLDNADLGTSNAILNHLTELFAKQDSPQSKLFDKNFKGKAHATVWDPALAMLTYDKTFQSLKLVQTSYDTLTTVAQIQNRFKAKFKKTFNNLSSKLSRGIFFALTLPSLALDNLTGFIYLTFPSKTSCTNSMLLLNPSST